MAEQNPLDKENNHNFMNITFRRRKKLNFGDDKPIQSILETTFNALPQIRRINAPLIGGKYKNQTRTIEESTDNYQGFSNRYGRPSSRQRPVIVKSSKLKCFFGADSSRCQSKRKLSMREPQSHRDSIQEKLDKVVKKPMSYSKSIEISSKQSKKQQFARLFKKQKGEYDRLLQKYGIAQSVSDEQFRRFMLQ